jgi:hypothetical protein
MECKTLLSKSTRLRIPWGAPSYLFRCGETTRLLRLYRSWQRCDLKLFTDTVLRTTPEALEAKRNKNGAISVGYGSPKAPVPVLNIMSLCSPVDHTRR